MYLKSIEVHGFKSFAQKLKFEFHNGITGIVGPNGSGKSNVVDAVRWVFGEQSAKQLRGGNMQDVIFAGTELRRPQSFAEVAITLDNADHQIDIDYEEVKITRRLYRSGESEYLINDHSARLKDINELFYDTGIGKEGYSIIGQNQIEKILSGKADDRRELFDEAAGIVKFKRRKNAAVKKLEGEQQNLTRINDILSEITAQLGPLRRQSTDARIYLQKKEALKERDINLYLLDSEENNRRLGELGQKLETATADLAENQKNYENIRQEYEELEQSMEELDGKIAATREKASACSLRRQELKGQIDVLKEQIRTVKTNDEHFDSRRQTIAEEISRRQNDLVEEEKRESALQEALEKIRLVEDDENFALAALDNELSEVGSKLAKAQADMIELLNNRASVKGKLQRYDAMLEQIDIRKAEVARRSLHYKEEENEARQIKEKGEARRDEAKGIIGDLEKQAAECEQAIAAAQGFISNNNQKLDQLQTAYHRDSSRLESLKNLEEQYDGYGNGIRRVMDEKVNEPGIVGVVAELLHVDKKYELAIETALGSKTRNIVTEEEQTAKRMIEFLKKNRLGRATFLPMTHINRVKRFDRSDVLAENGVIGLGSELVTADKGYEVLGEYLLGRTLVIDTIDHALKIGAKYHHSLNMVTLQGELFTPGGAITGGAFKNNTQLLGRKREIEELQKTTTANKKALQTLQQAIEEKRRERNDKREMLEEIHNRLQDARIRLNTTEMELRQAEETLTDNRLSSKGLTDENQEITSQIEEIRTNKKAMEEELKLSEKKEAALNETGTELTKQEEKLQNDKTLQNEKMQGVHGKVVSLTEQLSYVHANKERLNEEINCFQEEDEQLLINRETSGSEIEDRLAKIQEAEDAMHEAQADFEKAGEEERQLVDEKSEQAIRHKAFFDEREKINDIINRLDKEQYRLNSMKERLIEENDKQTAYMWEEYEITPSEARNLRNEEYQDRAALKKEVSKIKDDIRSLGNVNVNAIEEYKIVSERHEFLSTQQEDLIKSEETLNKIIAELDEGMRRQFNERFGLISTQFDKVVKELFGGGKGHLDLKDSSDVLETDISITVEPPGKKLQNINLLSGGERALTAICLLFAIQNLKPSPFCLLDEIEASLDENNTIRFASYLRKLTKHTQFVVITHRRGTMSLADRLYGITMMEKGISTLVSVNLIESALDN